VGLANLGSKSEMCVGSRVHLVRASISFEKNFYRLSFTPPSSLVCRIGPSAALVSQKFTFSVSISQKKLTERNVSFQVNSIVTIFGKQTNIPKITDVHIDRKTTSLAVVLSSAFQSEPPGTSNVAKKPCLDHRVSLC
jgi:hypothetical protein